MPILTNTPIPYRGERPIRTAVDVEAVALDLGLACEATHVGCDRWSLRLPGGGRIIGGAHTGAISCTVWRGNEWIKAAVLGTRWIIGPERTCECPLDPGETRKLYRVTGLDGTMEVWGYCTGCHELAAMNWTHEIAKVEAL